MDTQEYEESCKLKSHRKLNSHEGSQRVTRVKHHPLVIYTPSLYEQRTFHLGSSHKALERSTSSLRSKEWLQCPTIGASDVHCKHVSWNFYLIIEAFSDQHVLHACTMNVCKTILWTFVFHVCLHM